MKPYSKENLELLSQIAKHGPVTLEDFKEMFPKIVRHAMRLRQLVISGALRRNEDEFSVTTKARLLLAEDTVLCTVATPRRFHATGDYNGQRMSPMRPGSEDHLAVPSLMSGRRIYRKDAGRA